MRRLYALALMGIILLSMAAPATGEEGKIKVVATLSVFSSLAKEVGGDRVDVDYIVPEGTDIHSYTLTYEDVKKLESADLIILASSEFFSLDTNIKEKVEGKEILDFEDYNATIDSLGEIQRNIHGYWLYPQNAENISRAIERKLSQMDPENSEYYQRNLDSFLSRMGEVKEFMRDVAVENGIYGKRVLIAVPGVYYMVKAMGMEVEGSILKGPNQFIGSDEIKSVEEEIEKGNVIMIVNAMGLEDSRAGEIAIQISRDTGVKIAYIDIFSTDNYTSLLLRNAAILGGAGYVDVYSSGECNVYPYVFSLLLVSTVAILAGIAALRYRKALLD